MENRRDVEEAMNEFDQLSDEGKKNALEILWQLQSCILNEEQGNPTFNLRA